MNKRDELAGCLTRLIAMCVILMISLAIAYLNAPR